MVMKGSFRVASVFAIGVPQQAANHLTGPFGVSLRHLRCSDPLTRRTASGAVWYKSTPPQGSVSALSPKRPAKAWQLLQ